MFFVTLGKYNDIVDAYQGSLPSTRSQESVHRFLKNCRGSLQTKTHSSRPIKTIVGDKLRHVHAIFVIIDLLTATVDDQGHEYVTCLKTVNTFIHLQYEEAISFCDRLLFAVINAKTKAAISFLMGTISGVHSVVVLSATLSANILSTLSHTSCFGGDKNDKDVYRSSQSSFVVGYDAFSLKFGPGVHPTQSYMTILCHQTAAGNRSCSR